MTRKIGIISKKSVIIVILSVLATHTAIMAQESAVHKFNQQLWPLKWWAITHPFTVGKALKISNQAQNLALEATKDTLLDGDYAGGQIDAFRHAFWMATLTHKIGSKKALSLGKAHEKANQIQFKRKLLEEKYLPCSKSKQMDLQNNEIGIGIAIAYPNATSEQLQTIIKKAIIKGDLWVLWKDPKGNFLDCNGNIIPPKKWEGLWHSPKCVVSSDKNNKKNVK